MTQIFRTVSLNQTNSTYAQLVNELHRGELDVNAPYQRGHVWNEARQVALIKSLTMGLPTSAIYLNSRDDVSAYVVIDGKQRLTAVQRWLDGNLSVPAEWFDFIYKSREDREGVQFLVEDGLETVTFNELTVAGQRLWKGSAGVAVYWSKLTGSDAVEQEEALFNLINSGGLAQGDTDETPYLPE